MALFGALAPAAPAEHTVKSRISTGALGGNGSQHSAFAGASADGTRAFFQTSEQLVPEDTDTAGWDVYERHDGTTTLISTGAGPATGSYEAVMYATSRDGLRVFFATEERLTPDDLDSSWDVYERFAGVTTLVTTGPAGGNGPHWHCDPYATLYVNCGLRVSDDGSRVFFETRESLVSEDPATPDCFVFDPQNETEEPAECMDVYMREEGVTTLLSTGPAGGDGPHDAFLRGISADGSRAFFETTEPLVGSDADFCNFIGCQDVYEAAGGTTELASTGPGDAHAQASFFDAVSKDGTRLYFRTYEQLIASDTDSALDGYERGPGGVEQLTLGPSGGNANEHVLYVAASDGGERAFFITREALTSDDTDTKEDLYERSAGTTTLVSTGPLTDPVPDRPNLNGLSADGSHVFFSTRESLVSQDTDSSFDIYERHAGTTRLVSTGPADTGSGASGQTFGAVSNDGERVFFQTQQKLVAADNDTAACTDVYERSHGTTTTLLSTGPSCSNFVDGNFFGGASENGLRVFIDADDPLLADDTDGFRDPYLAIIDVQHPRPGGGTPLRVPLVPAYARCSAPNSSHVAPLDFPSCTPPVQQSGTLTMSSLGRGTALARLDVIAGDPATPADEADLNVAVVARDVLCRVQAPSGCLAAGGDFSGRLLLSARVRITDRANEYEGISATVEDTDLEIPVDCVATPASAAGGSCSVNTGIEALIPGLVSEGKRAVVETLSVELREPGPNGTGFGPGCPMACGDGDEQTYMVQGVFTGM